jgi:putative transposase
MARIGRIVLVDCPLHIVQRGINRSACFFSEGDYLTYLRLLSTFSARFNCSVHAYCLMTNHVHLLVTPHATNACALLMKNLSQQYVQRTNHRLGRSGTLWEGRFHSSLVTTEHYVLACYRYIELNPVRAGMVESAHQYGWSSHAANARGQGAGFLQPHTAFEALGLAAYRDLCDAGLSDQDLDEIRRAIRSGHAIGTPRRGRGRPWKLDEKNGVCPHLSLSSGDYSNFGAP